MPVRSVLAIMLLGFLVAPVFGAELKLRPPPKPFSSYKAPPAPDYANKESWAVWPGRASPADQIPPGIDGTIAKNPKADVFFIHPTTFLANSSWNAKYDEGDFTGTQLDQAVLRYQVSAFNGCCRMYAPRYRQATLSAFLNPGADANKSFDLAYSDVVRAFDYYLANANKGRPFILAESQPRIAARGALAARADHRAARNSQTPCRRLRRRCIAARDDRIYRTAGLQQRDPDGLHRRLEQCHRLDGAGVRAPSNDHVQRGEISACRQ